MQPQKISVKVYPDSRKNKVVKLKNNNYKIYTKAPAKNNMANKSVVELISKEFGIPQNNIKIVSGLKSKNKKIEITKNNIV